MACERPPMTCRSGPAWPGGCCARSSCALLPQAQGRAAHTRFVGRILRRTAVGGTDAIVPAIAGRAWITGVHQFVLDPDDRSPRASRSPAPGAPGLARRSWGERIRPAGAEQLEIAHPVEPALDVVFVRRVERAAARWRRRARRDRWW